MFSSIDLWKGCISVVPETFDGALVTNEFPIYEVLDDRLDPMFVSYLLRSRYFQRAFRAITTGHSNRRRTQQEDFEDLELCFPPTREEQQALIARLESSRMEQRAAAERFAYEFLAFSNLIDGRGDEMLPEINGSSEGDDE